MSIFKSVNMIDLFSGGFKIYNKIKQMEGDSVNFAIDRCRLCRIDRNPKFAMCFFVD